MFSLVGLLASYGSYHRDRRNRLTHFLGVPAIIYALLIAAALQVNTLFGTRIGLDRILLAVLVLWYLTLDPRLALALAVVFGGLAWAAEVTARLPQAQALAIAGVVFVLGWAVQLLGHRLEGNRPALLDNLAQMLVAPIYLMAELAFLLGLRKPLEAQIEARIESASAVSSGGTSSPPSRPSPGARAPGA